MRVLIIKMSSLGDIIHTLPAITDATNAIKDITFDWVVEEAFQEIPRWHPQIKNVIPVALRRWRKKLFAIETWREIKNFIYQLRKNQYDLVIDAQGLLKSAIIARAAKGLRIGPNFSCARDPIASIFYQKKLNVGKVKLVHAVTRACQLFSQGLDYPLPNAIPDYGINKKNFFNPAQQEKNYLVFLHGTTWATKQWPEAYWIELASMAAKKNFKIKLFWGNKIEYQRAMRIAAACSEVEVLPKLELKEIATILLFAKAVIAVDTGLAHLAAALDVPTFSLYSSTNPALTGTVGASQKWLTAKFSCSPCLSRECTFRKAKSYAIQPPCFSTVSPENVWKALVTHVLSS